MKTGGHCHQSPDPVGLDGGVGGRLRTCISNMFPGDVDATTLGPHFESHCTKAMVFTLGFILESIGELCKIYISSSSPHHRDVSDP